MQLKRLLKEITAEKIYGEIEDTEIGAIRADSRIVGRGELFVALGGSNADGHDYVWEAVRRGAAAVVCERYTDGVRVPQIVVRDARRALAYLAAGFYGDPQKKLKIIGVTGTNGKTTTCRYIASVLEKAGKRTGVIGTLGTFYCGISLAPDLTTPDPVRLFRLLGDMLQSGVEYVVMEVSAHAVHYRKTAPIRFAACVFTNCTQDHLDFFGTMERYAATKKKLFSEGRYGFAVVNADDPLGVEIEKSCPRCKSYAIDGPADHFAVIREEDLRGSDVLFNLEDQLVGVRLRLTGRYNVYNALAAAACARELGIPPAAIAAGLYAVDRVSGRLESLGSVNGGEVFVDFAHTPDGLQNVLSALKERCRGRPLCVFGCGGNRDAGKRPIMGEIAARFADFSVLTSDNPRYEEPYAIISAIEKGYRTRSKNYVVVQDRRKAIEYAMRLLRENDVLLVAGKGGENYQEIMGIKYDYNDNAVIEEIMRKMHAE